MRLPALREAEAAAAAALQRLTHARNELESEERRSKERVTELERHIARPQPRHRPRGRPSARTREATIERLQAEAAEIALTTEGRGRCPRRERGAPASRRGRAGRGRGGARAPCRPRPPTSMPAAPPWSAPIREEMRARRPFRVREGARSSATSQRSRARPSDGRLLDDLREDVARPRNAVAARRRGRHRGARGPGRGPRGREPPAPAPERGRAQGAAARNRGAHPRQALHLRDRRPLAARPSTRSRVQKGYETALGAALGRRSRRLDQRLGAGPLGRYRDRATAIPPCPDGVAGPRRCRRRPRRPCSAACARSASSSKAEGAAAARRAAARASGWSRARAISGAGTASPPPPKRPPPPPAASPRRTGWAISSVEAAEAREAVRAPARARPRPRRPPSARAAAARNAGHRGRAPGPAGPRRRRGASWRQAERREAELGSAPLRPAGGSRPPLGQRGRGLERVAGRARRRSRISRPAPDLESRLLEERTRVAERRAAASEARAALQALVHEAELRRRRQEAIAADIRLWTERAERAARALEDLGERLERAQEEHQRAAGSARHLSDAPPRPDGGDRGGRGSSARKRPTASPMRETNLAETDRAARAALEALSAAREARAGSQARHEAARAAPVGDHPQHRRNPGDHAGRADRARRPEGRRRACRPQHEIESKLHRLKSDRERLGAVNLRADEELTRARGQAQRHRHRARRPRRGDQAAAAGHRQPQPRRPRAPARRLRRGQRPFQGALHDPVRRRHGRADAGRFGRSAGSGPRNPRPPARQEAAEHDAAVGRRAGADRDGADLRGVPHQSRRRSACSTRSTRRSTTPMSSATATCSTRCRARPKPASWSSPTTRSPWRAWTACSASPWRSAGVSQLVSVDLQSAERILETA